MRRSALYSYVVSMGNIPLSTILIAIAMLCVSVLIVSRLGGKISLSRAAWVLVLAVGVASLGAGLYLHLGEKPAGGQIVERADRKDKRTADAFTFTFSPRDVRWGQLVEIQVPFPAESATVYLNGTPLPKRVGQDGRTLTVTIPTASKSGYIEIEHGGTRVRAQEQIRITP
jgi:hypothetical protein